MKHSITALVLGLCTLAGSSAWADAAVGVGVSWTFGGPKPVAGPAVGIKVFSTDKEDKAAASLGLDYSFADNSLRPNVGVAYLGKKNIYLGADIGYAFGQQGLNFGAGFGYVETKKQPKAVANTI